MGKINIKRWLYHVKHRYGTFNNVVILVALVIAASWVWGAVNTMQRNYGLQRDIDARKRQLELTRLEVATLEYQQNYYRSDEYRELAAREKLGLVAPGEKVLLLPPNSAEARAADEQGPQDVAITDDAEGKSNVEQWVSFLIGKSQHQAEDKQR